MYIHRCMLEQNSAHCRRDYTPVLPHIMLTCDRDAGLKQGNFHIVILTRHRTLYSTITPRLVRHQVMLPCRVPEDPAHLRDHAPRIHLASAISHLPGPSETMDRRLRETDTWRMAECPEQHWLGICRRVIHQLPDACPGQTEENVHV